MGENLVQSRSRDVASYPALLGLAGGYLWDFSGVADNRDPGAGLFEKGECITGDDTQAKHGDQGGVFGIRGNEEGSEIHGGARKHHTYQGGNEDHRGQTQPPPGQDLYQRDGGQGNQGGELEVGVGLYGNIVVFDEVIGDVSLGLRGEGAQILGDGSQCGFGQLTNFFGPFGELAQIQHGNHEETVTVTGNEVLHQLGRGGIRGVGSRGEGMEHPGRNHPGDFLEVFCRGL